MNWTELASVTRIFQKDVAGGASRAQGYGTAESREAPWVYSLLVLEAKPAGKGLARLAPYGGLWRQVCSLHVLASQGCG